MATVIVCLGYENEGARPHEQSEDIPFVKRDVTDLLSNTHSSVCSFNVGNDNEVNVVSE